ncbi:MAG TPA: HoxN/HupN/NixA family nickel/cobalt transporter, partial [Caldimonas sp.]|nr:HoxN/HupN/NixA family nickel/cobalt transporter [Caldimonas sp.]
LPGSTLESTTTSAAPSPLFDRDGWLEIGRLYAVIALLHIAGWGSIVLYARAQPTLVALGVAAYLFGLRHAFDVDHIAAVDDTVRLLLQRGRNALGVGFYFSLGHSTIVLLVAIAVALATTSVSGQLPALHEAGTYIGALVSGAFLLLVGLLNLRVLSGIFRAWSSARTGRHDHTHLESLLLQRGVMNRLFGGRLRRVVDHSWQMYPVGVLFGLGFDTASEISLLTLTAGASIALPLPAVLALPLLFAAGMLAMDTTDGVLMCKAYRWAFIDPTRKIFYNFATTGLSVAVALFIGSVELAQTAIGMLDLRGQLASFIRNLDFAMLGDAIVGLFILGWGAAVLAWRFWIRRDSATPVAAGEAMKTS